ncbi:MAG: hypothetical protein JXJ04_16830 [Spirochaetales bacterium]|nr:hypothetical protein [Spirochaetales bacterium]
MKSKVFSTAASSWNIYLGCGRSLRHGMNNKKIVSKDINVNRSYPNGQK